MRSLLLALALTTAAAAQPVVTIDLDAPTESFALGNGFEIEEESALPSSVLTVAARVPVGPWWAVVAEVPAALARTRGTGPTVADPAGEGETEVALGNPLVGVRWSAPSTLTLGADVRLPLYRGSESDLLPAAPSDAGVVGGLVRPEAREAFLPDLLSLRLSVEAQRAVGGVALTAEGGYVIGTTTAAVRFQTPNGEATEENVAYGALSGRLRAEAQVRRLALGVAVATVGRLRTIDEYRYPTATLAEATVALDGPLRPTLRARLPLSEFGAVGSVGVGVEVGL